MQRKLWVTGICALALALALPGRASATDTETDFDTLTCPIATTNNVVLGWNAAGIVDFLQTLAVTELGDDWTTLDTADLTIEAVQLRGQTSYAFFKLVEKIVSDADQLNHDEVCACVVQDLQQMTKDTDGGVDAFQTAHDNGDKTLVAIILPENAADVEAGVLDAFDAAGGFGQAGAFTVGAYCSKGELLNDDGDADNDGITNLEEWTNTFNGAIFGDGGETGFKALVDQYVLDATAGTTVAVQADGPTELLVGQGAETYTATSTDPLDLEFAWESTDGAIVSIDAGTGEATALAEGSVTITATGSNSNASDELNVTARVPSWYELCGYSALFEGQGALLAGASFATTWDLLDLDVEGGDYPMPDQFQFQLLAYSLCEGAKSAPSGVQVNVEYASNLAALQTMNENFVDLADWLGDGVTTGYCGTGVVFADAVLAQAATINAVLPNSGPTTGLANAILGGAAQIKAGWQGVAAAAGDIGDLGSNGALVDDLIAGYLGSPFGAGYLTVAFQLNTIAGITSSNIPALNAGADQVAGALLTAAISPAFPGIFGPLVGAQYAALGAERAKLNSVGAGDPGDPDPVNVVIPTWQNYDGVAKDSPLPFAGSGTYDSENGFYDAEFDTNAALAAAVIDGGGDAFDFVSLAAGLDGFVDGSPFVPAAGAIALGLMAGAMAYAGAKRVLRRS